MTASHVGGRTLAGSLIAFGLTLSGATIASAQPEPPAPEPAPRPAPVVAPGGEGAAVPANAACRQWAGALQFSSKYYNDFAYSIAGDGAQVDYRDPAVRGDNVDGRTALRKAAGEALSASSTPGLQPEIADPMRSWSLHAAKLVVIMGVRGNGDTLNNAATELNKEAQNTQMACANAGALPVIRNHS